MERGGGGWGGAVNSIDCIGIRCKGTDAEARVSTFSFLIFITLRNEGSGAALLVIHIFLILLDRLLGFICTP